MSLLKKTQEFFERPIKLLGLRAENNRQFLREKIAKQEKAPSRREQGRGFYRNRNAGLGYLRLRPEL